MTIPTASISGSSACSDNKQNSENKERLLPIEGAYNVRDLGGYPAAEGKTVKWGMLLRSGDLDKLTDADVDYFNQIPVRTYIDFRDPSEVEAAPDRKPASVTNEYHLPIDAGSIMQLHFSLDATDTLMEEIYRFFAHQSQETYQEFFRIVADKDQAPLLFHCSAGKDRTGFAAALLLAALGVDREILIEDFMLSATYLKDKYAEDILAHPQLEPLMTVRRSYIEAALEVIDKEYGGVENYLTRHLGVDLEALKKIYTE